MVPGRGRTARTGGRGWVGCACPPAQCPETCGFSAERLLTTGSPPARKCCPTPSTLLPTPIYGKQQQIEARSPQNGTASTKEVFEPSATCETPAPFMAVDGGVKSILPRCTSAVLSEKGYREKRSASIHTRYRGVVTHRRAPSSQQKRARSPASALNSPP